MEKILQLKPADFIREIEQSSDLLALPEAVATVLELTSVDDPDFENIARIICTDPALTGRLLRIANSPFYGLSNRVNSVHQAIMVLGLTTVKCLVLSAAIFHPRDFNRNMDFDVKTLYGNIISVAITSRKLAVAAGFRAPEEAFTCGLLHDVGALFLMHRHPLPYSQVLHRARRTGDLIDEEKQVFGFSHPEISRMITKKWRLPLGIVNAVGNHDSFGNEHSDKLDDILRLAVALNREAALITDQSIEHKITKISTVSGRLGISPQQLNDISATIMKDAIEFARLIEIDIGDYDTILTRANQEIFNTYMSLQKLFRERQELSNRILEEERARGVFEAKQVAVSTLAHYMNNATMSISGQAQIIRLYLKTKSSDEITRALPHFLDTIDNAVKKSVAVLEELSELNTLDNIEYFHHSKILNIDERIRRRLEKLEKFSGLVLPQEAEPEKISH